MTADITKQLSADDLKFNPPNFSDSVIHDFLKNQYGISGNLRLLVGERDQKIKVIAHVGVTHVLKIAGPEELQDTVNDQIKSLLHLQENEAE